MFNFSSTADRVTADSPGCGFAFPASAACGLPGFGLLGVVSWLTICVSGGSLLAVGGAKATVPEFEALFVEAVFGASGRGVSGSLLACVAAFLLPVCPVVPRYEGGKLASELAEVV